MLGMFLPPSAERREIAPAPRQQRARAAAGSFQFQQRTRIATAVGAAFRTAQCVRSRGAHIAKSSADDCQRQIDWPALITAELQILPSARRIRSGSL